MQRTLFLAALALGAGALAQDDEPDRVRLRGRVELASGQPWAAAPVVLVSRLVPGSDQEIDTDRIELTSDARGRFTALLLRNREYEAWALQSEDDGDYASSNVTKVRAGMRPVLKQRESRSMPVRIRLANTEEWMDCGLQVFVRTIPTHGRLVPLELDEKHEALLPPLPGSSARIEIQTGAGGKIHWAGVVLGREQREARHDRAATNGEATNGEGAKEPSLPLGIEEVRLPHRVPILVRVMHDGKSLPGTRLYVDSSRGRRFIGRTDDAGWGIYHWAAPSLRNRGWFSLSLVAEADGFAPMRIVNLVRASEKGKLSTAPGPAHALTLEHGRDTAALREEGKPDFACSLEKGATIRGRLAVAAGRPAPRVPLIFLSEVKNAPSQGGVTFGQRQQRTPVRFMSDKGGRFEITTATPGQAFSLHAALPRRVQSALPARLRAKGPLHTEALVYSGHAKDGVLDLGEVTLSSLACLELQITMEDGAPAAFPVVLVAGDDPSAHVRATADRLGRLCLLVPPGSQLQVAAALDGRVVQETCQVATGIVQKVCALVAPAFLSGRVVNGDGKPLPEARIYANPMGPSANDLLSRIGSSRWTNTDAAGGFRLPVREGQTYWLYAYYSQGQKSFHSTNNQQVHVESEPVTGLELVIDGAPAPTGDGKK